MRPLLSFAVLALSLVGLSCGSREKPLPIYGEVPQFVLTAETGSPFSSRNLKGKIWVADFMFTTCTGPCPRMSAQMRRVQNATTDLPDLKLVSFTVDPETDTPAVLNVYSKRFQADPERWHFLTGPQPALHQLSRAGFKLGDVDGSLMHSTRFVLVDRQGRVRGYYGTSEQTDIDQLLSHIRVLSRDKS